MEKDDLLSLSQKLTYLIKKSPTLGGNFYREIFCVVSVLCYALKSCVKLAVTMELLV